MSSHIEISDAIQQAFQLEGVTAAAVTDWESGLVLDSLTTGDFDVDLAASASSDLLHAKIELMCRLGMEDPIEEMLITLRDAYYVISTLRDTRFFFYVVMDRQQTTPAAVRRRLRDLAHAIELPVDR